MDITPNPLRYTLTLPITVRLDLRHRNGQLASMSDIATRIREAVEHEFAEELVTLSPDESFTPSVQIG